MKTGKKPTPTAILQNRGSRWANSRPNEPVYACGDVDCPDYLDKDGVSVWNELAPKLKTSRVLTDVDCRLLARYCQYWVMWLNEIKKPKAGRSEPDLERYANQCFKIERELGMTPSSRASLSVDKKDDKKDKFLRIV